MQTNECLNFTDVNAESLTISCRSEAIDINSTTLDWMDRTDTEVSINLFIMPSFAAVNFDLGHHKSYSLKIEQFVMTAAEANSFIRGLLQSMETAIVHRLALIANTMDIPFPIVFPTNFLHRLIGPQLSELELTRYPVGRVEGFHFNLTQFHCAGCQLECHNCTFSSDLQVLRISDSDSTLEIDIVKIVTEHPNLEELMLQAKSLRNPSTADSFIFPYHANLKRLHIETGGYMRSGLDGSLNVSDLVKLERLTIRNFCFYRPGEISKIIILSGLKKLVSLDVSFNSFLSASTSQNNLFTGLDSLRELRLSGYDSYIDRFWDSIEDLIETIHPVSNTLEILDLSQNQIDHLPTRMFTGMRKLRRLDVSKNNIVTFDGCALHNNIVLSQISLSENKLDVLAQHLVDCFSRMPYLRQLDLTKNRFECTCVNRGFRDWLKRTTKTRKINITYDEVCPGTQESAGVRFQNFSLSWIDCDFHKEGLALGSSAVTLVLIASALYGTYYFRYDIMYWWVVKRRHRVNRQHSIHPTKRFHAFLSYASSEQLIAEDIFFKLEEGDDVQFKIAYDCRDFLPIYTIADNIIRCIKDSEKVIFLISRQFIARDWTTFELDFAQIHAYDEKRNLIILIFVEKFTRRQLPQRLRVLCRNVNY